MYSAWGKFESSSSFHCLEHHCADVAACFEILIKEPVLKKRFERAAGVDHLDAVTEARLTAIAFLHDFGKINSGFQFKILDRCNLPSNPPPKSGHIGEAFYCLEQQNICDALGIYEMCDKWGEGIESLLRATLSHHGRPPSRSNFNGSGPSELWKPFNRYDPRLAAERLLKCCKMWFPIAFEDGPKLPRTPALAHLFAGIVAIADQIGSARDHFPFESTPDDTYIERARKQASIAMQNRGFCRKNRPEQCSPIEFTRLFDFNSLHPMQTAVANAPDDCQLLILESETGSGKTEAALIRYISLWREGLVDGLYFAVPTRAAAKQLHYRINSVLRRLFPPETWSEVVLAIPGYLKSGTVRGYPEEDYKTFWEDRPDEEIRAARWSAECARKFLSATNAVGTVDQALLGTLKVKWAHFRSASLARSLLVVDEVHASDTYMIELLRQLVHDHLHLGGYVMLMSATLGTSAKFSFCNKSLRSRYPCIHKSKLAPYPALTLVKNWKSKVHIFDPMNTSKVVDIRLKPWIKKPEIIAELALSKARNGGKVLVIRNTVSTAQAVFEAISTGAGSEFLLYVNGKHTLHHSRFAVEDRNRLDDAVEEFLGKNRKDKGCIVIGTQTLEQSLDIDADYLISDLCPADVLLQRVGRLHRHPETIRTPSMLQPTCIVLEPDDDISVGLDGQLLAHGLGTRKSGSQGIYRNLLSLELTRNLIAENPEWKIPEMNRMLVEQATHPEVIEQRATTLGGDWIENELKNFGVSSAKRQQAKYHLLDRTQEKFDDCLEFPDIDELVRTRLGEDGPRLKLETAVTGPFGSDVQTFNFPAHMLKPEELTVDNKHIGSENVSVNKDGIYIRFEHTSFHYDHSGLKNVNK